MKQTVLRIRFLVVTFLLSSFSFAQNCVLPNTITSSTLSYIRLPDGEAANFRVFYKVIVECGGIATYFDALHVLAPASSNPAGTAYTWEKDSVRNITGVLDPCVNLEVPPCYSVYYYHADILSPNTQKPFTISTTYCCRPNDAQNILFLPDLLGYENPPELPNECPKITGGLVGNSMMYVFRLPPLDAFHNSSPQFANTDTILTLCKSLPVSYQINAMDPDGDSVAYHFSTPRGYSNSVNNRGVASKNYSKYLQLPFKEGYSEQAPGGPDLHLNPETGLLDGRIDKPGTYDITVSALDYRNGILLDSTTEDLFIKVYDCGELKKPVAIIPDSINSCTDFTIKFPNYSQPINQTVNWNNTTFLWDFGDGSSSGDVYPTHTYGDTGSYHSSLIIFPGLHCADTAYSTVVVYPFVHAAFSYSDSCSDRNISFFNNSVSTSGTISGSEWMILKDTAVIFRSDEYNTSYNFSNAPNTYKLRLTVENIKGCKAVDSAFMDIFQSPLPLLTHDTILSRGASLQLTVDDGNFNFNGQYLWTPSTGLSDPQIANPILNSTTDTTYYVHVKNQYGCTLTDSIRVKYYTGPEIYVPNAFSPNTDGRNDIFKPIPVGISILTYFRVFDRNGQMVFETRSPHQGWDGNIGGRKSAEGTYVWEVSGIDLNGKTVLRKGTVILIR